MKRSAIKQKVADLESFEKPPESSRMADERMPLQQANNLLKQTPTSTSEKLVRLQRLHDLMAHNFQGGTICVLNRETVGGKFYEKEPQRQDRRGIEKGNAGEAKPLFFDELTLAQLKRAFDGDNVLCELCKDGKFYTITAVPLADGQNEINEILCVIQDFTDRKKQEESFVKALEREKELGELKSRFVTMASHEFRTPLTMILSSTFLLENVMPENYETERKVHTNRIKRAVNNLTLILNEFLSLEKLEQNKVEVMNSSVNIPEFLQDTLSEMEILKREKQVIAYQHLSDQAIASIDHHLLWSIITNLISNSIKYSNQGDAIEVTTRIGSNVIVITVKDHGIGIPDDEQQFIFGRFFRARNAVNIEGTGLGLHIIQKYIHLLNGTIKFQSKLDTGTTFTVTLPIATWEAVTQKRQLNS